MAHRGGAEQAPQLIKHPAEASAPFIEIGVIGDVPGIAIAPGFT